MKQFFPTLFFAALSICCTPPVFSAEPPQLETIRVEFQRELAILDKPIQDLNERYEGYLAKQKSTYQKAGNLDAVLAVEEEAKQYEKVSGNLSSFPELKRLQNIYRAQKTKLTTTKEGNSLLLIQRYRKKAEDLATQWTRANRIEEAKQARAEAEKFAAMTNSPASLIAVSASRNTKPALEGFAGKVIGDEKKGNLGLRLCWIAPGQFLMGSPPDEEGRNANREGQVEVTHTRGFWIGKYEVTQEEYEKVMGANPSHFSEIGDDGPADQVTWEMATEFCSKLTEREREKGTLDEEWIYTLPTEAQWEYACRAGSEEAFSGDDPDEIGWYADNSGNKTQEVGQKPPNAWGMHDMHGNVREWCRDSFSLDLPGGLDPLATPKPGSGHSIRGAGWNSKESDFRSAYRSSNEKNQAYSSSGFRVVVEKAIP